MPGAAGNDPAGEKKRDVVKPVPLHSELAALALITFHRLDHIAPPPDTSIGTLTPDTSIGTSQKRTKGFGNAGLFSYPSSAQFSADPTALCLY
jgi:hypothetical protein